MESHNNLSLLFISLYLVIFTNAERSPTPPIHHIKNPSPSPASSQDPEHVLSFAKFFPTKGARSGSGLDLDLGLDLGLGLGLGLGSSSSLDANLKADSTSLISEYSDVKLDLGAAIRGLNPSPEVEKICGSTDYPQLCITAVVSHLHKGKITVDTVFKAAVEASEEFAKHCQAVVQDISNKPGNPPDVQSALNDCNDGYETVVENFVETMDAFSSHDIGTMRSMLSAVITFVGDCEDDLTKLSMQTPLSGYAEKLTNMTSNCLAISDLMNNY